MTVTSSVFKFTFTLVETLYAAVQIISTFTAPLGRHVALACSSPTCCWPWEMTITALLTSFAHSEWSALEQPFPLPSLHPMKTSVPCLPSTEPLDCPWWWLCAPPQFVALGDLQTCHCCRRSCLPRPWSATQHSPKTHQHSHWSYNLNGLQQPLQDRSEHYQCCNTVSTVSIQQLESKPHQQLLQNQNYINTAIRATKSEHKHNHYNDILSIVKSSQWQYEPLNSLTTPTSTLPLQWHNQIHANKAIQDEYPKIL